MPVWNGLTDEVHPTQFLGDVLTMKEHSDKPIHAISVAFLGDAANNVASSLMEGGATLGMDVRLGAPRSRWPADDLVAAARTLADRAGGRLTLTEDPREAVAGADYVYTDVWVSMGEPKEAWAERIALLRPYQVDAALMASTGNPATRFLHCLPAFHGRDTKVGEEIFEHFGLDAMEVTDEVFESPASIVFDQAENRMHTIKAVLVATIGG